MLVSESHLLLQRLAATATMVLATWNLIAYILQNGALHGLEADSGGDTAAMRQSANDDVMLRQSGSQLDDDQLAIAVAAVVRAQELRRAEDHRQRLEQALISDLAFEQTQAANCARIIEGYELRRKLGRRLLLGRAGAERLHFSALESARLQASLHESLGGDDMRRLLVWLRQS